MKGDRPHLNYRIVHFRECAWDDAVVGPASFFPIDYQACFAEYAKVKRESRLGCIQFVLQLADTTFAIAKHVQE